MKDKKYYSTTEVAEILGISRIAVYQKIQNGQIRAEKYGHDFLIPKSELESILGVKLDSEDKKEIEKAVKKTVEEYGETLKMLGKE